MTLRVRITDVFCRMSFLRLFLVGGRDLFEHVFGSATQTSEWWANAEKAGGDWLRKHPVVAAVAPELRIPLGIHGDDGGMIGQDPVLVLSWNSVVALKPADWSRLLFTMLKVSSVGPNTMHTVYSVLTWSLTAVADGKFPAADHTGREFSKVF